ncbi:unnamed protein product [Paramecium sonneborni]|uniref:Uncharacterized protein n=1 Tax=Paramecium sonneborni TaxID=65129 RepID=A0A8S1QC68_9CILI|nr:unnamed protein product [Paramecium sonneborni]
MGQQIDTLQQDDEKGNIIGWCRETIEKLNEKFFWRKQHEDGDQKIVKYQWIWHYLKVKLMMKNGNRHILYNQDIQYIVIMLFMVECNNYRNFKG